MKKTNIWLHSKVVITIASAILFIIGVILILIACSNLGSSWITEKDANNINNILIGIATNLFGIIITISFVQYLISKQDEAKEQAEEINVIKRYDKYLQTLIRRYLMFYLSVTTRLKDRNNVDPEKPYEHSFQFSDLADMYLTSMYISDGVLEPSIVLFYKAEENVRDYMLRMLENIDFKYNPELEKLLISFTTKAVDLDMRGHILGALMTKFGNSGKESEEIAKWIDDESKDWVNKFKRGELQGNIMLPYVIFYYSIQDQVRMIKEYTEYVNKLY